MKYVNVEQLLNRLRGMISVREMERIKAAIRACAMVEIGYEEDCPINIKIEIDGVKYIPVWSFWLNGAVYKLGGKSNDK